MGAVESDFRASIIGMAGKPECLFAPCLPLRILAGYTRTGLRNVITHLNLGNPIITPVNIVILYCEICMKRSPSVKIVTLVVVVYTNLSAITPSVVNDQ